MSNVSGSLITRNYKDFRGVDFSNKEVSIVRSPDSLNMWKNYKNNLGKCIETRPDIELLQTFSNTVFGLFFYKVGNIEHMIVHCGTQLLDIVNGETTVLKEEGMNPRRSYSFVYNNILYIKDGINYLEYDGETIQEVVGYIPTTSISRKPEGGGATYEDVNLLTSFRKNSFVADGKATRYYLDAKEIDSDYQPIVIANGEQVTDFTVDFIGDNVGSFIEFKTAPTEPLTIGQDNVTITFKKTVQGHRDRINKCTLLSVFDNRVFFSGNENYPNAIFHSSLNDPRYCSDLDFYNEGLDSASVKSMVAGNNALWVFKEPSQANTTVFYHVPSIDSAYGKVYPSVHSSISTGCVATGINFNDDIVFFSDRGMEAINGDVTTEQVLAHRSSLVDNKLLNENNYKNMILEEWEGYLLVIIDNKVYLADSRGMFTNENHAEYEWFYWELDKNITCTQVKDGVLYLGTHNNKNLIDFTNLEINDNVYTHGYDTKLKPYEMAQIKALSGKTIVYSCETTGTASGVQIGQIRVFNGDEQLAIIQPNTPVTLPDLTNATSFIIYGSVTGATIKNYQIEEGTTVTAYSPQRAIYALTNNQTKGDVPSYWTTPLDEFNYPHYQKTTNKRGCVTDITGENITIAVKIDDEDYEDIVTHENITSYVVNRIKKKKWKSIQMKFTSNKPFSLYSSTLEAYTGSYVKR